MIRSITDFQALWEREVEATCAVLARLTERSLRQPVAYEHRDLGRLAWHIVMVVRDVAGALGFGVEPPDDRDRVPQSPMVIAESYRRAAHALREGISSAWTDATLLAEREVWGERWVNGVTLLSLVLHQAHHRGQMTVLMRQAGLPVPGIYGPAREEWVGVGRPAPAV